MRATSLSRYRGNESDCRVADFKVIMRLVIRPHRAICQISRRISCALRRDASARLRFRTHIATLPSWARRWSAARWWWRPQSAAAPPAAAGPRASDRSPSWRQTRRPAPDRLLVPTPWLPELKQWQKEWSPQLLPSPQLGEEGEAGPENKSSFPFWFSPGDFIVSFLRWKNTDRPSLLWKFRICAADLHPHGENMFYSTNLQTGTHRSPDAFNSLLRILK